MIISNSLTTSYLPKFVRYLRIGYFFLERQGLLGLWTKSSGNHIFNGGTLFGYLDDEWE